MLPDYPFLLRQKFLRIVKKYWNQNNHNLKSISCVYAIISLDQVNKRWDIEYVGSTTNLFLRYKSHKIPGKIQQDGKISLLYFLPMAKGFYDYEIKLIKKLSPVLNKQHKE